MKVLQRTLVIALVMSLCLSTLPVFAQSYDFGGKTVSFVGWSDNLEEHVKSGRVAEAEAKFNVKIVHEGVPFDDYLETLTSRLISGDSEYDVWRMAPEEPWFLSLASQGSLLSITDAIGDEEYYGDALEIAASGLKPFSLGGHYYPVALFHELYSGDGSLWTFFNKDIIEAAGLPDPYELYFNGEWTWEALGDIALATTIDFDNDGTIDQWGIANFNIWAVFTVTNGDNIYVLDENGQYKYNWNSEQILEGLAFGSQLQHQDKVTVASINPFEDGNAALAFGEGWRIGFTADKGINYGLLPLPRGPKGENTLSTRWMETWVLPSNTAQPEAMIALVDFIFRTEDILGSVDDIIEERVQRWATDTKAAQIISETLYKYGAEGELIPWALTSPEVKEALASAISGDKTPAEAMNAVASAGQAYVDFILGYDK